LIGISWTKFVSRQDIEQMIAFHRQRREEGGEPPRQYEFTFINRYGELRPIHLTVGMIPGTRQSVASFHDLTDVKQTELALRQKNEELAGAEEELRTQLEEIISIQQMLEETNEYLENLITHANAPIIVWDRDLRITTFNDAFGRLTGIPPEQAIGSQIELLFPEERREESMDLIKRAMAGEMWDVVEIPILNQSGEVRTVLWNSANIRSSDGEMIVATIAQGQDITDRKEAEQILLQKNEELHAAYEQLKASEEELKDSIDELTRHEQFIRESESRLRYLLGFYERAHLPEKELLAYALEGASVITGSQLGYLAFLNDDESELSMYAWSETSMKECSMQEKPIVYAVERTGLWGEAVRQRRPVITNDYAAPNPGKKGYPKGHPQIIRHMNVPILDGEQIVIVAGVANKPLDYTDNDTIQLTLLMQGLWQVLKRRRIEEEFRRQEEQLTEITEMVPGVVFQFYIRPDGEKGSYYISSRAEEVFGIRSSTEEFFERFTEQVDPRDRDAFIESIEDAAKADLTWNYEGRFIRPSGEEIWFQGMSRPIQRGSELLFNGILLDITDRKEAEVALSQTHKKLRILSSITSHDIANKIMTIRGLLEIALDQEDKQYTGICHDEIRKATDAIERQIVFMREYEQIGIQESSWIELAHLISRIDDSQIPVQNTCPEISFYADPMVEKVFQNLYMNTILHAQTARWIVISCEEREGALAIIWKDDGPGIPDDQKEEIFVRGFGKNTGFGLFLAREILAITGITIQETGTYGKGAKFEIVVPEGAWQRI